MQSILNSEVLTMLPQKYPFVFIDKILDYKEGEYAVGEWLAKENEWYFVGHYPDYPVLPGILQAEAIGQCASFALLTMDKFKGGGKGYILVRISSKTPQ